MASTQRPLLRTALIACAALCLDGCATAVEGPQPLDDGATSTGSGGDGGTSSAPGAGGAATSGSGAGASSSSASATSSSSSSTSATSSSSSSASSASSSSGSGGSGGGPVVVLDCTGCTPSPVGGCPSDVVVVGHYQGGSRTVCLEKGDMSPVKLVLMSYETTDWIVGGEIARLEQIQVYSVDPAGTVSGNGAVPTAIQQGGSLPADPYDYAMSMGDCPAHTGYAGAVFGVAQASVCHMESGLASECSYPAYTCLAIDP